MESKKYIFSNEVEVKYSTVDGGHIIIDEIFEFEPYKGNTLKDALIILDIDECINDINIKKQNDICYEFGDKGFKKEYKTCIGMSGGPMATALANYWYSTHNSDSWKENDIIVHEDWTFFDCITVDVDNQLEEEYKVLIKYLKKLIKDNPDFSNSINPIISYMKSPLNHKFFIIKYGFRYS